MRQENLLEYKIQKICAEIWQVTRTKLHLSMQHFDTAIYALTPMKDKEISSLGTDGDKIFYNEIFIIRRYQKNKRWSNRAYVHMILHCLFGHLFHRDGRLYDYWNLACDIVVESILDQWEKPAISMAVSQKRRGIYKELTQELEVLTAEKVYKKLLSTKFTQEEFDEWLKEFEVDDHCFWKKEEKRPNQPPLQQRQKKWEDISKKMELSMEQFASDAGENGNPMMQTMKLENRKRYQYSDFLRKFSILREEAKVDLDTFDTTYYVYGLNMYGNMPFIEPQEWKETQKIKDFVIAIDTSMSCSGELIQAFLEETYAILTETDCYFSKVNIHILQCDDQIREDAWITNLEQMETYKDNFEVKGYGGTDFRPVFEYVETLKKEKKIQDLKGLLYFTDGNGTYPQKAPGYEAAFVFLNQENNNQKVPAWAIKLVLEEQDLLDAKKHS